MRPLIGYNYGAKQHARVKKLYELTLIMSAAIMAAGTVICLFASRPVSYTHLDVYKRQVLSISSSVAKFCSSAGAS